MIAVVLGWSILVRNGGASTRRSAADAASPPMAIDRISDGVTVLYQGAIGSGLIWADLRASGQQSGFYL